MPQCFMVIAAFVISSCWQVGAQSQKPSVNAILGRKPVDTLLVPLNNLKGADCECGKFTRKVEDVRLAKVKLAGGRVPWLAELVSSTSTRDPNSDDEYFLCFGTVVSLSSVVFPASCIDRLSTSKPKVRLVSVDERRLGMMEVASVKIHPGYRQKLDNDIALVELKRMINHTRTEVVPACLPNPDPRLLFDLEYYGKAAEGVDSAAKQSRQERSASRAERPCRNPPTACQKRSCPCPKKPASPMIKTFKIDYSVIRTWFTRKAPGYSDVTDFGRFGIHKVNSSRCTSLFPEMLRSKVDCFMHIGNKDIAKLNDNFFKQMELGMPLIMANTTLLNGKVNTTRYVLTGMRSPGHSGIPMLPSRENVIPVLRVEDYVPWIKENSHGGHFCNQ